MVIKSKHTSRKHGAIKQRQFYLELADLFVGDKKEYVKLKESVYAELEQIIQAFSSDVITLARGKEKHRWKF